MDTHGKSDTEFRNEVSEILARHELNFDQIHNILQTILADLQAFKAHKAQPNVPATGDVNPFAVDDAFQPTKKPRTLTEAIGVTRLIQELNNLQIRPNSPFRNQPSTPPPLQHSNTTTTIPPTVGLLGPNTLSLFNQQVLFDSFVFKWQEKIIFIAFTTRFNTSFAILFPFSLPNQIDRISHFPLLPYRSSPIRHPPALYSEEWPEGVTTVRGMWGDRRGCKWANIGGNCWWTEEIAWGGGGRRRWE
ncbi:hypothetical protein Acr_11g0000230 [Actinidia rufa]|uniref:Uncharacterized protein n=1 Tax=Actinidia rufa TaxID=165716 RepID=A0A7J0FCT4_9ERIC|nr:hypothetical protein Acr_11g0000230 [Actinidia rufa]